MDLTKTVAALTSAIAGASCGSRLEERGADRSAHFWDSCERARSVEQDSVNSFISRVAHGRVTLPSE